MNASLASQEVQCLTLERVTDKSIITMRRLLSDDVLGYNNMLRAVTQLMAQVDVALGGDGDVDRCMTTAASAMISNSHRSFGFLLVACRDGLVKGSKGYGRLNTQLICEWCSDQEAKILGVAEADHSRVVRKNDNLGADWMNRLEHDATKDKARIAHLSKQVGELKNKLSEKP